MDNCWYAENARFIILDDEKFNYDKFFGEEFIQTSSHKIKKNGVNIYKSGLQLKHVIKAIKILNKEGDKS